MAITAFWQETEDWHTAGEPFRIVQHLPTSSLDLGLSVAEQRLLIMQTPGHPLDLLRQSLCHEPRGHADMYGCFITPPDDTGAQFGALFWHADAFSTACGHGTIALGYWAIAHGLVKAKQDGVVDLMIDVPSGRVTARICCQNGKVAHVDFINIASYQIAKEVPLLVNIGADSIHLNADLAFGGAVHACIDVKSLGLKVEPKNYRRFMDIQRQVKKQSAHFRHLDTYDVFGVIFFQHISDSDNTVTQKNVLVYGDGQIDRSPCGSGTASRVAILLAQGRMNGSKSLMNHSILDTVFEATMDSVTQSPVEYPACIARVRGHANLVGRMKFYIDPADPVYPGFVFR